MTTNLLYLFSCYIIGSLPLGETLARLKTGKSIIQPGSRSTRPPGEMFDILGIPTGIAVCLLDALKGFLTVFPVAIWFLGPDPYSHWWIISMGGLLTVIGHCNSPFLGFRGGRGLAPTFGVMVTLLPSLPSFLCFWQLACFLGPIKQPGCFKCSRSNAIAFNCLGNAS